MKHIVIILVICLFTSCQKEKIMRVGNGFMIETGTYYLNNQKRVLLKNLDDSGQTFAIVNQKGKILYQQPLNLAFSNSHYWTMYADKHTNIYFYNSDYSEQKALIWQPKTENYVEIDFCIEKVSLPIEFKKELKNKNSFKNCRSMD